MAARVLVSDLVRARAEFVGDSGRRWVHELPDVVAGLERDWRITVGEPLGGGWSYTATARTSTGQRAVLKVALPASENFASFERELAALTLADGQGYPRVLQADSARLAMLQERLGRPVNALGLPLETQIDLIAAALRRAWRPADEVPSGWRSGSEQALGLASFIEETWLKLDRPVSHAVIDLALRFLEERLAELSRCELVSIHGDAWPGNVLEDPAGGTCKLIDPDPMLSEPAHDLAIPLRGWADELVSSADPNARVPPWCARMGAAAGVDPEPIWQWAYVERLSTGLLMSQIGEAEGRAMLDIATTLCD